MLFLRYDVENVIVEVVQLELFRFSCGRHSTKNIMLFVYLVKFQSETLMLRDRKLNIGPAIRKQV